MKTRAYPVVGVMRTYTPMAEPFREFWTETMHGLAFVIGRELRILALAAHHEGRGDCGRFIAEAIAAYDFVGIYRVGSFRLDAMLRRRGFIDCESEIVAGEDMPGMIWRR